MIHRPAWNFASSFRVQPILLSSILDLPSSPVATELHQRFPHRRLKRLQTRFYVRAEMDSEETPFSF